MNKVYGWLAIVCAIVFAITIVFVGSERDTYWRSLLHECNRQDKTLVEVGGEYRCVKFERQ